MSITLPQPEREAIFEAEADRKAANKAARATQAALKAAERRTLTLTTDDPWTSVQVPTGFTGRLLGVFAQDTPEWHAARAGRIGASEIGVICGWAPEKWFTGRWKIMEAKLATVDPKPATGKAQRMGHYLEPGVAAWFADETGAEYLTGGDGTYVHPELDFMICNPDKIIAPCKIAPDGALLEIKTAPEKTVEEGWGRGMTDQIPIVYAAQVQWQMHVTGLPLCYVAVHHGAPYQFTKYRIKYDAATAEYLIGEARKFLAELTNHNVRDAA
jgi:putative phage-type endonuclease